MIGFGKKRSLTEFKRNTSEFLGNMKTTGKPMVLTVKGKAELVVQNAAAYERMLDLKEEAGALAGIQRGLDDVKQGRTRPARVALERIRKRRGIPRVA
jgi:PHD/YefM family antitoxin component YafN of YafNO toxin-antitoxin module